MEKLATSTLGDVFVPIFRENRKGMQPGDFLPSEKQNEAENIWREAADHCLEASRKLSELGVHKQWANRPLEWFGYINVLVTATEWDNFLELRTAVDEATGYPIPQDEMWELANAIQILLQRTTPEVLSEGEWHLPYVTKTEKEELTLDDQKLISAARCASISYQTVDGKPMTIERARTLGKTLMDRKHWSPFEHQAMADYKIFGSWGHRALHANFNGWAQNRHFLMERT